MSEQTERAWTLGPWTVVDRDGIYTVTSPNGNPINCYEVADTWRVWPDAALIALAPELAEAVLAWDDEDNGRAHTSGIRTSLALAELADKLHEIGTAS